DREILAPHHLRESLDPGKRGSKLVADDRDEIAFRAVQPLELRDRFALLSVCFGGRDRKAKLLRHRLDEADIVRAPFPGTIELRERERAGQATTDTDRRRRRGDDVLTHDVVRTGGRRETRIPAHVADYDGAPEPRSQTRDRHIRGA